MLQSLLKNCQYLLFQEKCRLCKRDIHPELFGMDFNKIRPPATYFFAKQEIRSEVICLLCSRLVLSHQSKQLVEVPAAQGNHTQAMLVASAVRFEEPLRQLIYRFKYDSDKLLAKDLAFLAMTSLQLLLPFLDERQAMFVPVPLHWLRLRQRGFNQSELLGQLVSKYTTISFENRALKRIKRTRPQQALGKLERLGNVTNAFRANTQLIAGRQVILIDDVITTGATLAACAQELYRKQAQAVFALTVACVSTDSKAEPSISQRS